MPTLCRLCRCTSQKCQKTPEAIDALVELLKSPRHDVRVDAARTLLEFGWGKPAQAVYTSTTTDDGLAWEKFLTLMPRWGSKSWPGGSPARGGMSPA